MSRKTLISLRLMLKEHELIYPLTVILESERARAPVSDR